MTTGRLSGHRMHDEWREELDYMLLCVKLLAPEGFRVVKISEYALVHVMSCAY